MNKKGFTLLELLAVIVVLAIIALIVTPFITKAIEQAKEKSFENSSYGIIDAAELYYGAKMVNQDFSDTIINLTDGVDTNNPNFKYKGTKLESAYIEINGQGKIRMYAYNNGFCSKKEFSESALTIIKTTKENCSLDTLKQPILSGGNSEWGSTRTISVESINLNGKTLDHYEYYLSISNNSLSGGEWIALGTNVSEIIITTDGEHFVYVRGVDTDNINGDVSSPETVRIDNTEYTITVPGTITGGSITASKTTAKVGEEITLTVSPSSTYELDTLTKNGTDIKGATTFIVERKNIIIAGTFLHLEFNIAVTQPSNGTINVVNNLTSATVGDTVTLNNSPTSEYTFAAYTVNGNAIVGNTFTMPNKNVIVSGGFYKQNYDYTGSYQEFTVPVTGYYQLEVWGAQGGSYSSNCYGGYGGYSVGLISLTSDQNYLSIYVGGAGIGGAVHSYRAGGYNGGGNAVADSDGNTRQSSGGGASHIATTSGLLSSLSGQASKILIVAAGGGGGAGNTAVACTKGGSGGGILGTNGSQYYESASLNGYGVGASQTNGGSYQCVGCSSSISAYYGIGSFGQGGSTNNAGGGSGYYGGGIALYSGGGGSGYVGNSLLLSSASLTKHMYTYCNENCTAYQSTSLGAYTNVGTNVSAAATSNYAKIGNGYAKVTYIGQTIN